MVFSRGFEQHCAPITTDCFSLLWDRSQWYLCLYPSISGHSLSTVALQLISSSPTLLILVQFLIKTHLSPLVSSFLCLSYIFTQYLLTNVILPVLFWDIRSIIPSVQKQPWRTIKMSQVGRLRAMSDLAVCVRLSSCRAHSYTVTYIHTGAAHYCNSQLLWICDWQVFGGFLGCPFASSVGT